MSNLIFKIFSISYIYIHLYNKIHLYLYVYQNKMLIITLIYKIYSIELIKLYIIIIHTKIFEQSEYD